MKWVILVIVKANFRESFFDFLVGFLTGWVVWNFSSLGGPEMLDFRQEDA